jgi:hypothetical protein
MRARAPSRWSGREERAWGSRARARRARPSAGGLFFERGKERFEDARRAAPAVNDGCFRVNKKRHVFLVRAPRSARLARSRRRRILGAASFRRATVFAIVFLREIFRVRQTDTHTKKVSSGTIFQERFPYVARKNEKDGFSRPLVFAERRNPTRHRSGRVGFRQTLV